MKIGTTFAAVVLTAAAGVLVFGGSAVNTSFTSNSTGSVGVSTADTFPSSVHCPAGHLTIANGNAGAPAHLLFTNTGDTLEQVYLTITNTTFTPNGASYPLYLNGGDDFNGLRETPVDSALPAKTLVGTVAAHATLAGPVSLTRDNSPGVALDDVDATYLLTGSENTCTP